MFPIYVILFMQFQCDSFDCYMKQYYVILQDLRKLDYGLKKFWQIQKSRGSLEKIRQSNENNWKIK